MALETVPEKSQETDSVSSVETEKVRRIENQYDLVAREKRTGDGIQIDVDRLVARDGDTFIFVDRLFDSGDLYGVTGTRMAPVHVDEHENRLENFKDPEWSPVHHVYMEQVENGLDKSWTEWLNDMHEGEKHRLMYDESYLGKYGEAVREHSVNELDHFDSKEDIHTVECHGGGRIFGSPPCDETQQEAEPRRFPLDQELDTVFNQSLLELVRNVEKTGLGVTE